jgi:uncharacterized damage-inducible protein DinB
MTKPEILTLFDFDEWATDRVLEVVSTLAEDQYVKDLGSSFGGVRGTLVHIYAADWIWLERWKGNSPTALIKEESLPTLAALKERWNEWRDGLGAFLASLPEERLKSSWSYKDIRGTPQTEPLWQQMQHLVNHSTYHRGQVAAMLCQLGAKPPSTDLINYYRLQVQQG